MIKPIAYSIKSATQYTGFSRSRLYKGIKAGRLPFKKIGKRTMFLATDLESFVLAELDREPAVLCGGGE